MELILDGRVAMNGVVLALGMFDGVHIGHRVLMQKARAIASDKHQKLVAVTFLRHPLSLIAPQRCPPMLSTFDERAKLLEELGVDVLYAMPFDRQTMQLPPEDYVGGLVRRFHPTDVVCGYNHTYGRGGMGTPAFMAALGDALGFATVIVPKITLGGCEVSSSAIRALLASGDVRSARDLLGRPYDRHFTEAGCHNDRHELMLTPNGKQDVCAGRYRALLECAGKRLPVTVDMEQNGRGCCRLPPSAEPHAQGELLFLKQM